MNHKHVAGALIAGAVVCSLCACGGAHGSPEVTKAAPQSAESSASTTVPTVPVVPVETRKLHRELSLPGSLEAYQDIPVHAKVEGYISWIGVDRGSFVHKGEPLVRITAPEVDAKLNEAQAKVRASQAEYSQCVQMLEEIKSRREEAQTKFDADKLTYSRLQAAAKTPGAVAINDLDQAQKALQSDEAEVQSIAAEVKAQHSLMDAQKHGVSAAKQMLASVGAMRSYLTITAPFDGVITERNVHPGSIVAVDSSRQEGGRPMLRLQQISTLRLVVAVPEQSVSAIKTGLTVPFTVPAYAGKKFTGVVARPAYALDLATRTMPVELDVKNSNRELEPGMFANVTWEVNRPYATCFVPQSSIAGNARGSYVIAVKDGIVQRVPVKLGQIMGNLQEITGEVRSGDEVALKPSSDLKSGMRVTAKVTSVAALPSAKNSEP